ncbi:MAG: hypothetical protein U0326_34015 [Polyangiales bacterium]
MRRSAPCEGWRFAASPADLLLQRARDLPRAGRRGEVSPRAALRILAAHLREPAGRDAVLRLHRAQCARAAVDDGDALRDLGEALARGALVASWRAHPRGGVRAPERFEGDLSGAPEEPLSWFEIAVIDDEGAPVSGVELRVTLDGRAAAATTDEGGVARLRGTERHATAEFASASQARARLRGAWCRPHVYGPAAEGDTTRHPTDPMAPVELARESRVTVVLLPFVLALRLPRALVAGRRVVLSSGGREARCGEDRALAVDHDHLEYRFAVGSGVGYEIHVESGDARHTLLRSPDLAPSIAQAVETNGAMRALPASKDARSPAIEGGAVRGRVAVLSEVSVHGVDADLAREVGVA